MRQTQVENMLADHGKRIKELENKFKEREQIVSYKGKEKTQGAKELPGVPNDITEEEAKKADLKYAKEQKKEVKKDE